MIISKQNLMKAVRIVSKDCFYCGSIAQHTDHIKPSIMAGEDCALNLVPACATCNCTKSSSLLDSETFKEAKIFAFINAPQVILEAIRIQSKLKKTKDPVLDFILSAPYY